MLSYPENLKLYQQDERRTNGEFPVNDEPREAVWRGRLSGRLLISVTVKLTPHRAEGTLWRTPITIPLMGRVP